jgi:hypothetical protein
VSAYAKSKLSIIDLCVAPSTIGSLPTVLEDGEKVSVI